MDKNKNANPVLDFIKKYNDILDDFWNIDNPQYDNLHNEQEQVKRQKAATKSKLTPISVDKELGICTIKGSGKEPYVVSLYNCTCKDYSIRKFPCKHMYRLAYELGVIEFLEPVKESIQVPIHSYNEYTEVLDKITGEITQYKTLENFLYDLTAQQLTLLAKYIKYDGSVPDTIRYKNSDLEKLIELGFFTAQKINLLDELNKSTILKIERFAFDLPEPNPIKLGIGIGKVSIIKQVKRLLDMGTFSNDFIRLYCNPEYSTYLKLIKKIRKEFFLHTGLCYSCNLKKGIKLQEGTYYTSDNFCKECDSYNRIHIAFKALN